MNELIKLVEISFYAFVAFIAITGTLFALMLRKCTHKRTVTRVLWSAGPCEETADFCRDCGTQVTETKTDCR